MPVMDGYEATIRLKEKMDNKSIPYIPIAACTAYAFNYDVERCFEYGMDDYISKPVKRDLLLQLLKKWSVNFKE